MKAQLPLKVDTIFFNNIVSLYELEKYILYYKLYNTSKYINSYHGWYHVRNFIWSLYIYSLANPYIHKKLIKYLMIAAIFHDFNYVGIEKNNSNYDEKNIDAAIDAWNSYCNMNTDLDISEMEFISSVISMTQYPLAAKINVDGFLAGYLTTDSNDISTLILDCDHSMPLFYNYIGLCWQFLTYEMQAKTYDEYVSSCGNYLQHLHYNLPFFQKLWYQYKKTAISTVENCLESVKTYEQKYSIKLFGKDFEDVNSYVCFAKPNIMTNLKPASLFT